GGVRLGGAAGEGSGAVALHQPLADHRAGPLEGAVAALGRRQGDDVADLGVVDGVLEPIGQHRVAVGDVEGDVELEPLPDLLLGFAHPVVGVDREAAQLDFGARLDAAVRRVGVHRGIRVGHRDETYRATWPGAPSSASATFSASASSFTSWTRRTEAPAAAARIEVAIVPPRRTAVGQTAVLAIEP